MSAEKGSAFLLKISDGAAVPVYTVIAGLRATGLTINADAVNITHKGSQGWRTLLSGAGIRSVALSGSGVFTNSAAEILLRDKALSGDIADYEIQFESSDKMSGAFLVTKLDYSGDFNGERTYAVALESSGPIQFGAGQFGAGQ